MGLLFGIKLMPVTHSLWLEYVTVYTNVFFWVYFVTYDIQSSSQNINRIINTEDVQGPDGVVEEIRTRYSHGIAVDNL